MSEKPCSNCGYCPACGRRQLASPYMPYHPPQWTPWVPMPYLPSVSPNVTYTSNSSGAGE